MQPRVGAAVAVVLATLPWAPGARAQSVEIKVRIPEDIVREVNRVVGAAVSPGVQRDIADALHDAAESLAVLKSPEIHDAMIDAVHGLANARAAGWLDGQGRNFPAKQTDRQTKTFQVGPAGRLTLDTVAGDITIAAGSGRDVTVEIVRESRGRTDADAKTGLDRVRVETDDRGGRASVRAVYPSGRNSEYSVSVHYTVTAPPGTEITAYTIAGNVSAKGIHGDLSLVAVSGNVNISDAGRVSEARTTAGNVTLTNVETDGTITASTTSGAVTTTSVKARRLDLGTVGGTVAARDVAADTVDLHSIGGNLEWNGPLLARGRYRFITHSGGIHITADGRTGFEFEGSSFSGLIRSDLPLQVIGSAGRGPRRNLRGTFGDGSASITATTFSGNVTVTKK